MAEFDILAGLVGVAFSMPVFYLDIRLRYCSVPGKNGGSTRLVDELFFSVTYRVYAIIGLLFVVV